MEFGMATLHFEDSRDMSGKLCSGIQRSSPVALVDRDILACRWRRVAEAARMSSFSFVNKGQTSDVRHTVDHLRYLQLIRVERVDGYCKGSIPCKLPTRGARSPRLLV